MHYYVTLSNIFQLMRIKMWLHYPLIWSLDTYKVCIVLSITVCTLGYVCLFCGNQIVVYFVSFLFMIIYEILYTWCLRYNILQHLVFRYKNIDLFYMKLWHSSWFSLHTCLLFTCTVLRMFFDFIQRINGSSHITCKFHQYSKVLCTIWDCCILHTMSHAVHKCRRCRVRVREADFLNLVHVAT